ncbi:LINE-1 reverse transcriptase [Plakobranchus ocellatus]|uniref:LINE-1 reverse transcriptase n=1 Tax=Plakobranchus ocellatus TaxID=259542 RepID=A0AAV3YKF7_9GAST|nr:LINE-1 reverse transcriptase [Plakobranchus ocellatus]
MLRIRNKIKPEIAEQCGFVEDKGTSNAIHILRTLIERTLEVQKDVYLCFTDYTKAFDRVRHDEIITKLKQLNIDGKDLRIIKTMYWEQTAAMRIENKTSTFQDIKRGVRQGCVLSPDLFSLYSEIIMRNLENHPRIKVGPRFLSPDLFFLYSEIIMRNLENHPGIKINNIAGVAITQAKGLDMVFSLLGCVEHPVGKSHFPVYSHFIQRNKDLGVDVFTKDNPSLSKTATALSIFAGAVNVKMPKDLELHWKNLKDSLSIPITNNGDNVKQVLGAIKIKTLYRWKTTAAPKEVSGQDKSEHQAIAQASSSVAESEVIGLLTRLTEEASTAVSQTSEALRCRCLQLAEKQLRSRQRDNLKRLLLFAPSAGLMANYVVCLATWIFSNLDSYDGLNKDQCKHLQKRLKSSLQAMENIRTYTAPDKNKWNEAGALLLTEIVAGSDKYEKGSYFKNSQP